MRDRIALLLERMKFKLERYGAQRDPKAWRMRHPLQPVSEDRIVRFFIPLFEKVRAPNWHTVERNLARTLAALARQSDGRWVAFICGQDRPTVLPSDPRVRFLHYPTAHGGRSDKNHKMRFIARAATKERRDGYAFFLDADDIPHPRLVEHVLGSASPFGYHLPKGYAYSVATGEMAPFGMEPNPDYRFTTVCGSSHAVRFDTRRDTSHTLHVSLRGDHRSQRERLATLGLDLEPIPFGAMIYTMSHGTSDQDLLKGGTDKRPRLSDKHALIDIGDTDGVLAEFGLSRTTDFSNTAVQPQISESEGREHPVSQS